MNFYELVFLRSGFSKLIVGFLLSLINAAVKISEITIIAFEPDLELGIQSR